jgi:hypothetical protein
MRGHVSPASGKTLGLKVVARMREAIHTFKIVEFQQFKIRLTLSTTSGFNNNLKQKDHPCLDCLLKSDCDFTALKMELTRKIHTPSIIMACMTAHAM